MSSYNDLKEAIDASVKENGQQDITGPVMNQVLTDMVEKTLTCEDPEEYEGPDEGELGDGYYTKSQIDAIIGELQEKLISGYNIKTLNGRSLLGNGNIPLPQGPMGPQGPRGPQGPQGNTGSSVDYPFELVNNLTTNDSTKALTAAMGKQLKDLLTEGYLYVAVAIPTTNPGTPTGKVFYIASTPGTYSYFNSTVVNDGEVAILKWNGSWSKETTGVATTAQLNQLGQEVVEIDDALGKTTIVHKTKNQTISGTTYIYCAYSNYASELGLGAKVSVMFTCSADCTITPYAYGTGAMPVVTYPNVALSANVPQIVEMSIDEAQAAYGFGCLATTPGTYDVKVLTSSFELLDRIGTDEENVVKGWILSESFSLKPTATYADGIINSPVSVIYPDGVEGTLTITRDAEQMVTRIDATHGTETFRLSVTRDSDGNVLSSSINKL